MRGRQLRARARARRSASSASPGSGKSTSRWPSWACCPRRAQVDRLGPVPGRRAARACPSRSCRRSAAGHRHDLPGPDDLAQPGLHVGCQIAEAMLDAPGHRPRSRRTERAIELLGPGRHPACRGAGGASYPHEFSGGMRQRVVIAIAMANDPDVIIADEPTTALDVTIQAQVLEALRAAQRGDQAALILITHDLGVVAGHGRPGDRDVRGQAGRDRRRRRHLLPAADALHARPARLAAPARHRRSRSGCARSRARRRRCSTCRPAARSRRAARWPERCRERGTALARPAVPGPPGRLPPRRASSAGGVAAPTLFAPTWADRRPRSTPPG